MPAFAAIDPGPLENRKEYGSKPASRAKTTETFPPIGSVPLIPMNELVNALGAGPQSAKLFCFWIKYEPPTADRGSHGAPLPCQVSWQSVEIKPQPSVHVLGAEAAVAAEAPVGTTASNAKQTMNDLKAR